MTPGPCYRIHKVENWSLPGCARYASLDSDRQGIGAALASRLFASHAWCSRRAPDVSAFVAQLARPYVFFLLLCSRDGLATNGVPWSDTCLWYCPNVCALGNRGSCSLALFHVCCCVTRLSSAVCRSLLFVKHICVHEIRGLRLTAKRSKLCSLSKLEPNQARPILTLARALVRSVRTHPSHSPHAVQARSGGGRGQSGEAPLEDGGRASCSKTPSWVFRRTLISTLAGGLSTSRCGWVRLPMRLGTDSGE